MDIATLGLRVDTSQLARADRDLDRFERSADEAERSAERFGRTTSNMGANVRRAATQIVAAAGGIAAANRALQAAEQYRSVTNGFIAMGQSAEEAAATVQSIADIANRTRAPLQATADLYRRLSTAADDLGASSEDVANFTETVGMALAASGTSAQEASGALLQLSQAMAGGTVRAEEFNSILEGAYPIALAAARGIEETGGSVGKLREMVVAGEISSREFMEAVLSQQAQIRGAFEATTPTVAQAMQVLSNNFTMVIGGANEASGVTTALADSIMFLADNLETVLPILAGFGAVAGVIVAPVLALAAAGAAAAAYLVVNWEDLRARFPGITGAVEAAMGAMRTAFNVIRDVVVNVVAAVEAALSGDWVAAWDAAKEAVDVIADAMADVAFNVYRRATEIVQGAKDGLANFVSTLSGIASDAVDAFLSWFLGLGDRIFQALKDAVERVKARAQELVQGFLDIGRDMAQGLIDGFRSRSPNLGAEAAAMGRGAETAARRALETQSPSRVFRRIGEDVGDGLALGMESMIADVEATAGDIADAIVAATKDGLGDPASIGKSFVDGLLGGMADGDLAGGLSGFLGSARQSFMNSPMMSSITQGVGSFLAPAMPIIGGISTAMNLVNGFSSRELVGSETQRMGTLGAGGGMFDRIEEEFKKTSFWGLKSSTEIKTSYQSLADETQQVRETFGGLISGIRDAGAPLGIAADAFRDIKVPIVDGDIAGALAQADASIAAMIPGLSRLQGEGETVAETLGRLSGALATYNASAAVMRLPGLPGTVAGAGQAADILSRVDLAGASSALFGMQDPGMQLRLLTSEINREMRRIGLSGPVTDSDQLLERIQRASGAGRATAAAGLASLAPLVGQRDDLRASIIEDRERQAEQDRLDALRASEEAARDAARAEEELARARERLAREVSGFEGFSTFREQQIATALAGRAGVEDELKDVLELLSSTMRIIAANTGRQADDTSILVAQGVV